MYGSVIHQQDRRAPRQENWMVQFPKDINNSWLVAQAVGAQERIFY
jgi:hypothetical protein